MRTRVGEGGASAGASEGPGERLGSSHGRPRRANPAHNRTNPNELCPDPSVPCLGPGMEIAGSRADENLRSRPHPFPPRRREEKELEGGEAAKEALAVLLEEFMAL